MKAENILAVIDKLGEMIIHSNNNVAYLEYENQKLKEKLEKVERYIEKNIVKEELK